MEDNVLHKYENFYRRHLVTYSLCFILIVISLLLDTIFGIDYFKNGLPKFKPTDRPTSGNKKVKPEIELDSEIKRFKDPDTQTEEKLVD